MVLPPNRIGGVRGPGGATLDDLLAALTTLNDSVQLVASNIDAQFSFLEGIFARLGILSGGPVPPTGWAGLPDYLARVLAPADWEGSPIVLNTQAAVLLLEAVSRTLGNFGGEGTTLPARTLHELAGDIRNALVAGEGENVYERLGSVRDNALAILDAIGTLPSTPAGETVKALLAALVECCEGGGEPPGPQPENPYPALCEDVALGPWRMVSYADANGDYDLGGPDFDAYVLQWPDLFSDTFGLVVTDTDGDPGAPGWDVLHPSGEDITFCLSWDLTDNNAPGVVGVTRAGTGDWYTELGTTTTIAPFIFPAGNYTFTINNGVRFYVVVFMNPGTPPPVLNFHLAVVNSAT